MSGIKLKYASIFHDITYNVRIDNGWPCLHFIEKYLCKHILKHSTKSIHILIFSYQRERPITMMFTDYQNANCRQDNGIHVSKKC